MAGYERNEASNSNFLSRLQSMIHEIRQLQPPEGMGVASVDGGSFYDFRVSDLTLRFGSFSIVQKFHWRLRRRMDLEPTVDPPVQNLVQQHSNSWPLSFTHGSLISLNIMVH